MTPKLVLLPCQGDPLTRVWLPSTPDGLVATVRMGDTAETAVRRKAVELGLTPVLHQLGTFQVDVYVWVCWVRPGEVPRGLEEASVQDAARHAAFRPMILRIQEAQAGS